MKDYILYQKKGAIQEEAYAEWTARFPYTIDYDLIKVTENATEEDILTAE